MNKLFTQKCTDDQLDHIKRLLHQCKGFEYSKGMKNIEILTDALESKLRGLNIECEGGRINV